MKVMSDPGGTSSGLIFVFATELSLQKQNAECWNPARAPPPARAPKGQARAVDETAEKPARAPASPGGGGAARGGGRPASPRTGLLEVAEDQVVQLLRTDRHRAARARPSPLGGEAGRVPVPLALPPPPFPPAGGGGGKKGPCGSPGRWKPPPPGAEEPPPPSRHPRSGWGLPEGESSSLEKRLRLFFCRFFFLSWFWVFFFLVLSLVWCSSPARSSAGWPRAAAGPAGCWAPAPGPGPGPSRRRRTGSGTAARGSA